MLDRWKWGACLTLVFVEIFQNYSYFVTHLLPWTLQNNMLFCKNKRIWYFILLSSYSHQDFSFLHPFSSWTMYFFICLIVYPLFRNESFMLDEMFQQNASFATLLENKRPTKIFQICVSILTSFSHLINALV